MNQKKNKQPVRDYYIPADLHKVYQEIINNRRQKNHNYEHKI